MKFRKHGTYDLDGFDSCIQTEDWHPKKLTKVGPEEPVRQIGGFRKLFPKKRVLE